MIGFQFEETMTGTYRRDGSDHRFEFRLRARQPSMLSFLRDRTATIEGHVDAAGLATHAVLAGTLLLDPILGRRIRYDFGFTGDDGESYRFAGQKDVDPHHPVDTMTTLPGEILDDSGAVYATALVRFDPRSLPSFLGSFRPLL